MTGVVMEALTEIDRGTAALAVETAGCQFERIGINIRSNSERYTPPYASDGQVIRAYGVNAREISGLHHVTGIGIEGGATQLSLEDDLIAFDAVNLERIGTRSPL